MFYALWIPVLFTRRVNEDKEWTLLCPKEAYDHETGKGLMDMWDEESKRMYLRLKFEKKGRKTVKAQQLWFNVLESQMETTGNPYMRYKDHCNRNSNQMNLGSSGCGACSACGNCGAGCGARDSCSSSGDDNKACRTCAAGSAGCGACSPV